MTDKSIAEMTGLDYLERVVDGRIEHPSMAHTLNFRLTDVEHGRAVISGKPNDDFCNPNAHGLPRCSIPAWAPPCTRRWAPGLASR